MEQAINRYQSPYRMQSRKIEVDKKAIKYWSKFVKQTIISAVILATVIACENVEVIANSEIWNKATEMAKRDLNIEQVRSGIEWGIEYVKVAVPEIINSQTEEKEEHPVVDTSETNVETIELKVEPTLNMTQEEKDIYNIVKATTIMRP